MQHSHTTSLHIKAGGQSVLFLCFHMVIMLLAYYKIMTQKYVNMPSTWNRQKLQSKIWMSQVIF